MAKGSVISYSPVNISKRLGWLYLKFATVRQLRATITAMAAAGLQDIVLQSVSYGNGSSGRSEIGKITFLIV